MSMNQNIDHHIPNSEVNVSSGGCYTLAKVKIKTTFTMSKQKNIKS